MSTPEPSDALIEAVARGVYPEGTWCTKCEFTGWDDCPRCRDFAEGIARAAYAAMVEHLGLTEETCCEQTYREQEETGKYNVYTCSDLEQTCRTRLVSRWEQP